MNKKTAFAMFLISSAFVLGSCNVKPSDTSVDVSNDISENTSEDETSDNTTITSESASDSIDPSTTYTVTFDLNYTGAEGAPAPQEVLTGGLVNEPTAPERTDFTFKYWARNAYGSGTWIFATDVVTSSITLYATWEYSYVEPPVPTKMYYLNAPAFWLVDNYTAGIYAWDADGAPKNIWPGEKMTFVEGEIFSFELAENYINILFVRLTPEGIEPAVGSKSQSVDIDLSLLASKDLNYFTLDEDARYGDNKCRGRWSVYPNDPDPYPPVETRTIYVDVPAYWHSDGHVAGIFLGTATWALKESWPGEKMTLVSGEIYRFEVPEEYVKVIFNALNPDGTAPVDKKAQTVDELIPSDDKNLFTIDETVVYMDSKCTGTWSVYSAA